MTAPADESLAREAAVLARYLLDVECPPELCERYAGGLRVAGLRVADPVAAFAFEHPWTIGFLDAAGAFTRAGSSLRSRILLMSAVLEASPRFAATFLPPRQAPGPVATIALLARHGVTALIKAIVGAPLLIVARIAGGRA